MTRAGLLVALALIPGFALADTPESTTRGSYIPSVRTRVTTTRSLPNTMADVSLGIAVDAHDSASVVRMLGERSQALIAFLRDKGADKLQTTTVDISQQTHTVKGGPDIVVGYSGRLTVSFRTTPERLGALVSGALTHGANTLDQATFGPEEAEVDSARRELAVEATRLALAQAKATAEAAEEHVTQVGRITIDPDGFREPQFTDVTTSARFAAVAASPPPIATAAGEQRISVTVEIETQIAR